MLWLADHIKKKHPNGFVSAIIYGDRGVGKSTYQMTVAKDLFMVDDGLEKKEAYQKALDKMLYRPNDLIREIEEGTREGSKRLILLDDASAHLSKYLYFEDRKQTQLLQKLTDTLRTATTGFLMSCPSPKNLLKTLKSYPDYSVKITRRSGDYRRKATIYKTSYLPSGMPRVHKLAEDDYSCYIPKEIWREYKKKRKQYLTEAVSELKEHMNIGEPEDYKEETYA